MITIVTRQQAYQQLAGLPYRMHVVTSNLCTGLLPRVLQLAQCYSNWLGRPAMWLGGGSHLSTQWTAYRCSRNCQYDCDVWRRCDVTPPRNMSTPSVCYKATIRAHLSTPTQNIIFRFTFMYVCMSVCVSLLMILQTSALVQDRPSNIQTLNSYLAENKKSK